LYDHIENIKPGDHIVVTKHKKEEEYDHIEYTGISSTVLSIQIPFIVVQDDLYEGIRTIDIRNLHFMKVKHHYYKQFQKNPEYICPVCDNEMVTLPTQTGNALLCRNCNFQGVIPNDK